MKESMGMPVDKGARHRRIGEGEEQKIGQLSQRERMLRGVEAWEAHCSLP